MKKLYTAKVGQPNRKDRLLIEGEINEIVDFINSVGDGCRIGKFGSSDLDENGGNMGFPPDEWSEPEPYFYNTPTDCQGGFSTLEEAVEAYADSEESLIFEH